MDPKMSIKRGFEGMAVNEANRKFVGVEARFHNLVSVMID
jgi:hypothetical protein